MSAAGEWRETARPSLGLAKPFFTPSAPLRTLVAFYCPSLGPATPLPLLPAPSRRTEKRHFMLRLRPESRSGSMPMICIVASSARQWPGPKCLGSCSLRCRWGVGGGRRVAGGLRPWAGPSPRLRSAEARRGAPFLLLTIVSPAGPIRAGAGPGGRAGLSQLGVPLGAPEGRVGREDLETRGQSWRGSKVFSAAIPLVGSPTEPLWIWNLICI